MLHARVGVVDDTTSRANTEFSDQHSERLGMFLQPIERWNPPFTREIAAIDMPQKLHNTLIGLEVCEPGTIRTCEVGLIDLISGPFPSRSGPN